MDCGISMPLESATFEGRNNLNAKLLMITEMDDSAMAALAHTGDKRECL